MKELKTAFEIYKEKNYLKLGDKAKKYVKYSIAGVFIATRALQTVSGHK